MSRYDRVERVRKDKVIRIGTSDLPKFEEHNSDILLIATEGDRCDLISHQYYGTTEFWWYIASVNNLNLTLSGTTFSASDFTLSNGNYYKTFYEGSSYKYTLNVNSDEFDISF